MKEIKLLNKHEMIVGTVTVDDSDFESISETTWRRHSFGYAVKRVGGKQIFMHRMILDAPDDMEVDHINGNPQDNRRSNLRLCTHRQNGINRKMSKNNTSGYRGVYFDKGKQRYRAMAHEFGKQIHIGWFRSPAEASEAFERTTKELYGEFLRA